MIFGVVAHYLAREIAPRLDGPKCLNFHRPGRCQRCVYSCPTGAILSGKQISIAENKCSGCGVCAAACPTNCLELPGVDWPAIYASAQSCQMTRLGCRKSSDPLTNTIVPCVGAIPAELFAALSFTSNSFLIIDLAPCFKCEHKGALLQLRRSLRRAEKYTGTKIRVKGLFPKLTQHKDLNLINDESIATLKRYCKELSASMLNNYLHGHLDSKPSLKFNSSNRLLLKSILKNNAQAAIYLTSWQVSAKCTGCGLCQGNCPHNAWDMIYDSGSANLVHYPWRCSGCNLCAKICPVGAKHLTTVCQIAFDDNYLAKRTFQTRRCIKCRQIIFMNKQETELCPSCLKRKMLLQGGISHGDRIQ